MAQFDVYQTIEFFEDLGIVHKIEDRGKVFPMSDQASSVLDVLRYQLEKRQVKVICNAFVQNISVKGDNRFQLKLEDGSSIEGDRVIIATGGKAMPSSGSDGNGYHLARQLGHSIVNVFPGLVQIMLEGSLRDSRCKICWYCGSITKNKSVPRIEEIFSLQTMGYQDLPYYR